MSTHVTNGSQTVRILCLHGARQNGDIFATRLKVLERKCQDVAQFVFVDGPRELPLEPGQQAHVRVWWRPDVEESVGVEAAAQIVQETWNTEGPFDGLLGFSQGAALAAYVAHEHVLSGLQFVVCAGGYVPAGVQVHAPLCLPSLHLMGKADEAVPWELSKQLADTFEDPVVYIHTQGHCVPQRSTDTEAIRSFLQKQASTSQNEREEGGFEEEAAMQAEEIEALQAIYDQDFELRGRAPPNFTIRIDPSQIPALAAKIDSADTVDHLGPPLGLNFTLPRGYPLKEPPTISVHGARLLGRSLCSSVTSHLVDVAQTMLGEPVVFALVSGVVEYLCAQTEEEQGEEEGGDVSDGGESEEEGFDDGGVVAAATAEALETSRRVGPYVDVTARGRWDYVVGLVGKPSAGKSTLFNAFTHPISERDEARVAAFPFTTIEPNLGLAHFAVPCPCTSMDLSHCSHKERLLPVTIKDVAGLVPGAYQGRGKGNKFLDDLCDADVLIHVVDVSGTTDKEGQEVERGAGDPAADIGWVREEIHRWIYNNVKAKWHAIERRPGKLLEMFTGYRATPATTAAAVQRAGLDPQNLSCLRLWSRGERRVMLHRIVAHFLCVRFPVMLALNKLDMEGAPLLAQKIDELYASEATARVSARSEFKLHQLLRDGHVIRGSGGELVPTNTATSTHLQDLEMIRRVFSTFGGTGVKEALSKAVSLRPPTLAFPVGNLDTCAALLANQRGLAGGGVLADCVLLRPGSTVETLYEVLKKPPYLLLDGEYVRSECRLRDGKVHVLKKDERMGQKNQLVHIMTNKKVSWQAKRTVPTS